MVSKLIVSSMARLLTVLCQSNVTQHQKDRLEVSLSLEVLLSSISLGGCFFLSRRCNLTPAIAVAAYQRGQTSGTRRDGG